MPRTNDQIGSLAFALFEELSRVRFSVDELKDLGEHVWANDPTRKGMTDDAFREQSKKLLGELRQPCIAKLFKTAQGLDSRLPLPDPTLEARIAEVAASAKTLLDNSATDRAEIARLRAELERAHATSAELGRELAERAGRLGAELPTEAPAAPVNGAAEEPES